MTAHLIPLISAFIKSPRGDGESGKESGKGRAGRQSASLIKAKQAVGASQPAARNICRRNNYSWSRRCMILLASHASRTRNGRVILRSLDQQPLARPSSSNSGRTGVRKIIIFRISYLPGPVETRQGDIQGREARKSIPGVTDPHEALFDREILISPSRRHELPVFSTFFRRRATSVPRATRRRPILGISDRTANNSWDRDDAAHARYKFFAARVRVGAAAVDGRS